MAGQPSPQAFAQSLSENDIVAIRKQQPRCDEREWQVTGCPWPPQSPLIYIKYGDNEMSGRESEARTQQWAYEALQRIPHERRRGVRIPEIYRVFEHNGWTYILMEYVVGRSLHQIFEEQWDEFWEAQDQYYDKVEKGLRLLLSLPVPRDAAPGPVGGGIIRHPLFKEHRAPIQYDSLDMLERHLNKVATMITTEAPTVKLERELHLVFADLYEGNFIFTDAGDMYIIDFEHASFLPLSFMSYALIQSRQLCPPMQDRLEKELPQGNMKALRHICTYFVMSVWNIGLPL